MWVKPQLVQNSCGMSQQDQLPSPGSARVLCAPWSWSISERTETLKHKSKTKTTKNPNEEKKIVLISNHSKI